MSDPNMHLKCEFAEMGIFLHKEGNGVTPGKRKSRFFRTYLFNIQIKISEQKDYNYII